MKPTNIQDDHHFVKLCKQKDLIRENGKPIGIQPWAFALRKPNASHPEQERTVSGVYYEFFDGTAEEKMYASFHFIDMVIKKKEVLARLEAGPIKAQGQRRSRSSPERLRRRIYAG